MTSFFKIRKAFGTIVLSTLFVSCVDNTTEHASSSQQTTNNCQVKDFGPDLALKWYDLELKLIRREVGITPPVAARLIGYTGVVLYESLVGGMPGYQSLSKTLNMPALPVPMNKNTNFLVSANAAFSFTLKHFITSLSANDLKEIDDIEKYFNDKYGKGLDNAAFKASVAYGNRIADIIYQWSTTDGGREGHCKKYSPYTKLPSLPGMWEATSFAGGLLPDWGKNRSLLAANAKCEIPPPPAYSDEKNSELYKQAMEVYSVFLKLTAEQGDIAKFWADPPGATFTPAGHSIQLLCQVINEKQLRLDSTAIAFVKSGIALNDAFIACWKAKYEYNYIRPITYIRKHIRKDWLPFITTPSFPEYPSGHSVQSAAMAEIMTSMFGSNCSFTDISNDTLGYPARSYATFKECADEAAISRLYGGIHYRVSVENGLKQGERIGANVNEIRFKEK